MPNGVGTAAGAYLLSKFGLAIGASLLGAAVLAVFDPPATRTDYFKNGLAAAIGGTVFGPLALRFLDHTFDFIDLKTMTFWEGAEIAVPVLFVIGALSMAGFQAFIKFRQLFRERAAQKIFDKWG